MILADKIIQLRKRCGMSQNELAELINVSRQSVSKWEGALSVPDLDKILKMSEIFGVSTDYLLKDDIEENLTENTVSIDEIPPLRRVSMEEANNFLKINNQSSFKTALGVALCIMSPVVPAMLDNSSGIITAISDTSMFIMVAVAVALFISASASKKSYSYLKKEGIDTEYGVEGMLREKLAKFSPIHIRDKITGIILCILSVVPSIIVDELFNNDIADKIVTFALFSMVAVGIFLIVRVSSVKKGFSKLLEEDRFTREKKTKDSGKCAVIWIFWCIVTAIYLGFSFLTWNWAKSWIIFPIALTLTPVVYYIDKKNKLK